MRVIYLDVDSLRPDHLGAYGYGRPTSPVIDELARGASVLTETYGSSSPCMPSRASLMSGRFGIANGVLTHWGAGSAYRFPGHGHRYFDEDPVLPRHLRQHGYRTVSFSSFMDRHQAFWFGAGWTEMQTFTLKQGDEDADEVTDAVIPWLEAHGRESEDLFLHVQYWDPHRQYTVPERFIREVESSDIPDWLTEERVAEHGRTYGPFTARELFPGRREATSPVPAMPRSVTDLASAHRFLDGYDGAVRFLDEQIGRLLDALARLGILDDTAIVLSADHGEALGEEGVYGDHTSAAPAVHHVPMIVRWPGMPAGEVAGLTYQLDLAPTICELLGVPVPPGWDARSFAAGIRGEAGWRGRERLVWDHGLYAAQRVVRTPEWTYRRSYHPGVFEHAPVSLWRADDEHQLADVADGHPEVVDSLEAELVAWRDGLLARTGLPDPLDEILAAGGPFRYVQPEMWARYLTDGGREADARRMLAAIEEHGAASVT